MNLLLISRSQLEIINRKTLRYPLQIAEKDYFLTLILRIISESKLGKKLIFKGGTALYHCYLEQSRFSEDLDFSSNQNPVLLAELRKLFDEFDRLKVVKNYSSKATVKIEKLRYIGPLIQPNSLKVEIDFLQNVLLPPKTLKYHNVWGVNLAIKVMDIREICAEKIRAMNDRARYRDFYDLFLILDKYKLDLREIAGYIKEKEIRKLITKSNIKDNWKIIKTQKEKEMNQIYYSREVKDAGIETMIDSLPFTSIANLHLLPTN